MRRLYAAALTQPSRRAAPSAGVPYGHDMTAAAPRRSSHGWRIVSLGGIPVYLARSWPVIAIAILALYGPTLAGGERSALEGYLIALAYAVLLLFSVLLHEAAHALAARWKGQRVDRVVADMWGGHTVYDATRSTPGIVAIVAVVGPLSNVVLGLAGLMLLPLTDGTVYLLLRALTATNLFVGVFNLLPGLPMDGGQIVSALVWGRTGRRSTGLVVAGWLGRIVALGSVVWGVRELVAGGGDFIALIWVMVAMFLWKGASDAIRTGPVMDATAGPVAQVLEPSLVVSVGDTLERAIDVASRQTEPVVIVVTDDDGAPVGTLSPEVTGGVPVEARSRTPVSAVYTVQPPSWVVTLPATATVADLVRPMVTASLSAAVIVEAGSRRVLGVARAERLNDFIGSAIEERRR